MKTTKNQDVNVSNKQEKEDFSVGKPQKVVVKVEVTPTSCLRCS